MFLFLCIYTCLFSLNILLFSHRGLQEITLTYPVNLMIILISFNLSSEIKKYFLNYMTIISLLIIFILTILFNASPWTEFKFNLIVYDIVIVIAAVQLFLFF